MCAWSLFFVTLELDFADMRRFPPGTHPGVLLLRPGSTGPYAALAVLRGVVEEYALDSLNGCLAVADESRTCVRHPNQADHDQDEDGEL